MKAELMLAAALGAAALAGCGLVGDPSEDPETADIQAEYRVLNNGWDGTPLAEMDRLMGMRQCYLGSSRSSECLTASAVFRGIIRGLDSRCFLYGDGKSCTQMADLVDYMFYPSSIYRNINGMAKLEPLSDSYFSESKAFTKWLDVKSANFADAKVNKWFHSMKDGDSSNGSLIAKRISQRGCYATNPDPLACSHHVDESWRENFSRAVRGYELGDPVSAYVLFLAYGGMSKAPAKLKMNFDYANADDLAPDLDKSWFYLQETCRLAGSPELCSGITRDNVWNWRKKRLGSFRWIHASEDFSQEGRDRPWLTAESYGAELHVPYRSPYADSFKQGEITSTGKRLLEE